MERFEVMEAEKARYPIALMARVLEVTRAGCYAWRSRGQQRAVRASRQRELDHHVADVFVMSDQTYGAGRIRLALARRGIRVCERTVAASMRRQGLVAVSTRMFRTATTIRGNDNMRVADVCERVWDKGRLDAVWITDFTYLRCGEGWVYLIAIRDAHSRRVLGWAMDEHMRNDLVIRALLMAFMVRGGPPRDIVLHADRGAQFTSRQLADFMDEIGGHVSMGRTGVCWDNAMAESFWATLKVEFFYRHAFRTRAEVYEAVDRWIDAFYNKQRIHTALGGMSPIEYELSLTGQQLKAA